MNAGDYCSYWEELSTRTPAGATVRAKWARRGFKKKLSVFLPHTVPCEVRGR